MARFLKTRKPLRWLAAAAVLAGGTALLAPRSRVENLTPATPAAPAAPAATLGPLPVALSEESPRPARLSGAIETALSDLEGAAGPPSEASLAEMRIPPCAPPPLGDDPWRPSTRVASYQSDSKIEPPPQKTRPRTAPPPNQNATPQTYLTHRIADGDTLSGLAQRYLGSSQRFSEIFAANRHLLASPDLLPIGVELQIPADTAFAPAAD